MEYSIAMTMNELQGYVTSSKIIQYVHRTKPDTQETYYIIVLV